MSNYLFTSEISEGHPEKFASSDMVVDIIIKVLSQVACETYYY